MFYITIINCKRQTKRCGRRKKELNAVSFKGRGVKPISIESIEQDCLRTKKTYPGGIYIDNIDNPYVRKFASIDIELPINVKIEGMDCGPPRLLFIKFEKDVPIEPPTDEEDQLYKVFRYDEELCKIFGHNEEPLRQTLPRKGLGNGYVFNKGIALYPIDQHCNLKEVGKLRDRESFKSTALLFFNNLCKKLEKKESIMETVYSFFTNTPIKHKVTRHC